MGVPSRTDNHGGAAVAPFPPGDDATKKILLSAGIEDAGNENTRDDQPLLKPSTAGEHNSKSEVDSAAAGGNASVWSMKRVNGLGFIVFAAFNFSIASLCVKYASHRVTSHETVFWRMFVAFTMSCIWSRYKKRKLEVDPKYRRLLLFRCIVGTIGVNLQFYAMSKMVLTDAVVIIFLSPIFTFFLGAVVLKESIDRVDFAAATTAFVGALFVTRPAIIFGTGGDVAKAPVLCVDHVVAIHYFFSFGTITSILTILFMGVAFKVPTNAAFLFSVFGSGFFSFVGQIFLTKGFQIEKAGIASVMRYFDVVFVVVMDIAVLGERVNGLSIVGAAIIMSGASLIVLPAILAVRDVECSEGLERVIYRSPLPPDAPRSIPDPKPKLADVENDDQPLLKSSSSDNPVAKSEVEDAAFPVKAVENTIWSMKRAQGLGFIVFAGLNFSIASICIKYASHRVTSHETVFWRMTVALVLNYIWARYKKRALVIEPKYRGLLLFRCFVGTVGVNIQFYAMSKMVLTDAVVIILTSPIFTFFLGAAVLGEKINRVDLLAGITSFVGVMFVTRPAFLFPTEVVSAQAPMLAIYCAIGGSLTSAAVYILLRRLTKVDPLATIHYFFVFGTCTSIMTILLLGVSITVPLEATFLFAIFGSGFFSFIGQVFMTKGFQREKAGIASVMRYFDVVFVVAMDVLILGEHVNALSLLGAGIIMAGVSMIVLRRAREKE
ncbi:hypothetical protein PF005_g17265 [Phytophthora fragariae]|uniref:EamA domain-containing protein n=1 Tax=Phytophthora fragariae TaxID=53985 RepID=A0A6A3RQP5_9STRA|nr:hypothetical protein PF007_g15215 [Phytophthora fragariae]KAE9195497.1 hypothetical protein PF005_g17265 [Phytophthora fragariae]